MEEVPTKKDLYNSKEEAPESNKENVTLEWATKNIGKKIETSEDAQIANMLKVSENDVYPLSIYFSENSKRKMKITRFTVFIALFYFLVPFDLYITSTDYRIGYFGTAYRSERISFSEDVTETKETF
jgi:hypothetical protein